jgi:D-alanyl-D-alanine carboxypeptidase
MRRVPWGRFRWHWSVVGLALVVTSCTLNFPVPGGAPQEVWDSSRNTHPAAQAFQTLLDRFVGDGLPGVVLLVSTPEGRWEGAAGYANIEAGEPMLPTHLHHAASVTKMYTATAVLLLVEEGLIDLDAAISEYLPESVFRPIPNGSEATVRQLLGHTSGIPDFSGALAYDLDSFNDPMGPYPPEQMLGYLHGQTSIFSPGTGYFYSNANYLLLAMIVDRLVEAGHAGVISEHIIQPLGLRATYYKNEAGYPSPPGLVNSYQDLVGDGGLMNGSDLAVHSAKTSMGYAGVIASAADYATFVEGLLEGRIIGESMLTEMQTRTEWERYGLGLHFLETPYGLGIGHSGGSFGILSQIRRFPEQDATLILLSNGGDGGVPAGLFNGLWNELLDMALGK